MTAGIFDSQKSMMAPLNIPQRWFNQPLILHKLVVMAAMLAYFYFGYMEIAGVNKHRPDPLYADIFLDHLIPLVPAFILFYMLGYFFVVAPVFFIDSHREFYSYAAVFWLLMTLSFLVFALLPIAMEKELAQGSDWLSRLTRLQQETDTRYNNLPSLHVSLNLLTWLYLRRKRPAIAGWLAWVVPLVVASTLLVKQHLVLDCVTGLLAGFIAYYCFSRLCNESKASGVLDAGSN